MTTRVAPAAEPTTGRAAAPGWPPLVLLPPAVLLLAPAAWPSWAVMWALAAAVYAGCKWLTWRRSGPADATPVPVWRHVAYLLLWPGLDADAFLAGRDDRRPVAREWASAFGRFALGLALLGGAVPALAGLPEYARGWVGMTGIALVLHFGLFHLLSCLWRSLGVDARPLMDRPLAAASLSEFWGRRWNTAFRDLTHRFLFRPLASRFGPRAGLLAGFSASGLVHDLVISVPAGGGYGGPTAYFLLQAAGLLAERGRVGRRLGLGRGGWRGRPFAAAVVALPVPLLFHPPFVGRVVIPFLRFLGAW